MLAPSGGGFDPLPSLCTWMAFGGNTRDLGSFGEETDKITDLHQIHEEVLFTEHGDGVAGIKRRRRDLSSDGVRDLATMSRYGRLKEDLELSTQRRLDPPKRTLVPKVQLATVADEVVAKRCGILDKV
nr:hypothetical protein [Tanacetum cinerariifolium]